MQLTKTDFIQYLNCSKSLWWLKREPETYPHGEFSVFLQKITREGYEVERYVRQFFESYCARAVDFQTIFETEDGLYARADAFEYNDDGVATLYEIKSSTSVKTDASHNHIKDVCFQKICAERSGQAIGRVFLVHLNGNYVRDGEIDPAELLTFKDVTDQVAEMMDVTEAEIDAALNLLQEAELDRDGCSCLRKSRANHCDTFSSFNPDIPVLSIYNLPRLSQKKRDELVTNGIFDLSDVPDDYALSANQELVLFAAKDGTAQIDLVEIQSFLDGLLFPLYFFDFETYGSAVPLVDGASPHKQFPVQYSLHVLHEDGQLEHKEFLQDIAQLPLNLIEQMKSDVGSVGSIVSWHASFEKTQNREMAKWFPEHAEFLTGLNERTVDLEDIFKKSYVDARFKGSTSIKKVLPVTCPHLGYDDLDVQDGAAAMDAWKQMTEASPDEAATKATALLAYCEMDTFAMVEIFLFLRSIS